MTRDEMIEKLKRVQESCAGRDEVAALASVIAALRAPAVHDCEAWRLEGLGCAVCNKRAPAVTGAADKALDDALNDALYKDTQVGHMLPWREVARLCDAFKQRLAAPPAAGAPPALVALVQRLQSAMRSFKGWTQAGMPRTADHFEDKARAALDDVLAWSPAPAPVAPPTDGSVMVRVDPVYVEQMRGDGLAGPFSRITLDERGGVPTLLLTAEPKPTPDTAEWWRAVAQELGVEIHKLKLAAQWRQEGQ